MEQGWIKLSRNIKDSPVWSLDDQYGKTQAFIDLLFRANYKDTKKVFKGKIVEIKRGSLVTSEVALASAWNWNRKTVKRFLLLLEKLGTITVETSNIGTTINIANFNKYQDFYNGQGTAVGTTVGTAVGTAVGTTVGTAVGTAVGTHIKKERIEKKDKNVKKERKERIDKKEIIYIEPPLGEMKNVLLTLDEFNKLKNTYYKDYEDYIDQLSHYISSTGKKYKSHYSTICGWMRKANVKKSENISDEEMAKKYGYTII